ncbi:hypothetical protein DUNSADRAFT_6745 [Dunaliella salina]|uniref:Secreted protein n=1 Tax=Dunaliella salina TaxID=3046 RepID=A0ABQ7H6R0_DUNSA|nr:hypothetical protein DUNSADRAFT_6745 [Dunaliella salina]|eukprot:KAF5842501.1 hypothetical protein DUNSADRAFT_6745 [Dunaliella salina]
MRAGILMSMCAAARRTGSPPPSLRCKRLPCKAPSRNQQLLASFSVHLPWLPLAQRRPLLLQLFRAGPQPAKTRTASLMWMSPLQMGRQRSSSSRKPSSLR